MSAGRLIRGLITIFIFVILLVNPLTQSSAKERNDVSGALQTLTKAADNLQHGRDAAADKEFASFKKWWQQHKSPITKDSPDASIQLNQDIGSASLAMLNGERKEAVKSITAIRQTLQDYQSGLYGGANKSGHASLSAYITELNNTEASLQSGDWATATAQVRQLQQDWLSVEGDVVSQSQSIYTESEKNLVMIDAYLADPSTRSKANPLIKEMIANLKPLAAANYGMWDAALIPIREGLEALLVIGALLSFAKKAQSGKARVWIWGGTTLALVVCLAIGIVVSLLFSAAAFGNSNALINGWSGVLASLMLLYVGYWLHRNSDIRRWRQFIQSKTEQAISRNRMISFALLAFIAVLREGMETVIFLIGMAGRMPVSRLALGIALGFAVLIVIGVLMLKIGLLLPLRPFFFISSLIVFYLCFKFMGSGIHSLQMAGVLPPTVSDILPSVNSLSIFPSWYSTIPQLLFLIIFILILMRKNPFFFHKSKTSREA